MKHFYLILAAMMLLTSCNKSGYDVYLLIGQSNMAGRGTMIAADTLTAIEGVWLLDGNGLPEPAKSPLNKYSGIRKRLELQQICPGNAFAEEMHKANGKKILLVVNARGGSALEDWMKANRNSSFFEGTVGRTLQAQKYGKLKAILWHQGESNSSRTEHYLDSLQVFVSDLRKELGEENVPFIAGEIAGWHKNAGQFNEMISHISEYIPEAYYVSSLGCTQLKDDSDPHFSRDGQLLLGKRYAEKLIEISR